MCLNVIRNRKLRLDLWICHRTLTMKDLYYNDIARPCKRSAAFVSTDKSKSVVDHRLRIDLTFASASEKEGLAPVSFSTSSARAERSSC